MGLASGLGSGLGLGTGLGLGLGLGLGWVERTLVEALHVGGGGADTRERGQRGSVRGACGRLEKVGVEGGKGVRAAHGLAERAQPVQGEAQTCE